MPMYGLALLPFLVSRLGLPSSSASFFLFSPDARATHGSFFFLKKKLFAVLRDGLLLIVAFPCLRRRPLRSPSLFVFLPPSLSFFFVGFTCVMSVTNRIRPSVVFEILIAARMRITAAINRAAHLLQRGVEVRIADKFPFVLLSLSPSPSPRSRIHMLSLLHI